MLFVSEINGCGLKYRIDTTDIYPVSYHIVSNFAVSPTPTIGFEYRISRATPT